MAGLIVMEPLGNTKVKNFIRESMSQDQDPLTIMGKEYPRMQILSVEEILNGKRFETPTVAAQHIAQPRMPGSAV